MNKNSFEANIQMYLYCYFVEVAYEDADRLNNY